MTRTESCPSPVARAAYQIAYMGQHIHPYLYKRDVLNLDILTRLLTSLILYRETRPPRRKCSSPLSSLSSPLDTASWRKSSGSHSSRDAGQTKQKEHYTYKANHHAQANTHRPKPVIRDSNGDAHSAQGARHELLLPVVRLQGPRQLRGNLRGGRRQLQPLLRCKSRPDSKIHLNSRGAWLT